MGFTPERSLFAWLQSLGRVAGPPWLVCSAQGFGTACVAAEEHWPSAAGAGEWGLCPARMTLHRRSCDSAPRNVLTLFQVCVTKVLKLVQA